MKKLLLAGSNGFLGSRIAAEAARRNWSIVGISRSHVDSTPSHISRDLTLPGALSQEELTQVQDCTAAVHCIGTLFDNETYKKLKKPGNTLCEYVSDLSKSPNSLQPIRARSNPRTTIEAVNRDTALNFFEICKTLPELKKFLFVSTASQLMPFPFQELVLDKRYWRSKQQFELVMSESLDGEAAKFDRIIVRPGFMYSDGAPFTLPVSSALTLMNYFKSQVLPRQVSSMLPPPPARPLHVDTVARFIVDQLESQLEGRETRLFDSESMFHSEFR